MFLLFGFELASPKARHPQRRIAMASASVWRWSLSMALPLTLAAGQMVVAAPPTFAEDVSSPGGWSTLHRSAANRKWVEDVALATDYTSWTALEGAAVLTAPTMSPDGQTLYVASGRARGESNLFAFTLEGEEVWRSAPWSSPSEGVDPCAILSSPIVDLEGDIYLGDCNQLFAFRPNGEIKWVTPLPERRLDDWDASEAIPINALTTAAFTKEGHVFGVTNFGDVVLVERATGRSLIGRARLPGHLPAISNVLPMPDSTFGKGLVDPEIRDWAWQLLVGGAMRSANTPAVDLESGRIFVAGTSMSDGLGALFGLDLIEREGEVDVEIAFLTDMGPGSGSSPALSPESDRVYVSDEEGVFYSIDAKTGEIHWQVQTKAASAAAAVGGNGVIYTLQAFGPALIAIDREGNVLWESDLAALAKARLPRSWLLGAPAAIGNGNPTVVGNRVLVPVVYGYETHLGRRIPWAVESSLVAVDVETGVGVMDLLSLEDDSTGITAVLPNGVILNSLGTAMTSGLEALQPLEWMLPGERKLLTPRGGLQVSTPVSKD